MGIFKDGLMDGKGVGSRFSGLPACKSRKALLILDGSPASSQEVGDLPFPKEHGVVYWSFLEACLSIQPMAPGKDTKPSRPQGQAAHSHSASARLNPVNPRDLIQINPGN